MQRFLKIKCGHKNYLGGQLLLYIQYPILLASGWVPIIVSFPDPPQKVEKGLVFSATFLVTWGGAMCYKECHNCIFKSDTEFLMPYNSWLETTARSTGTPENRPFHYLQFGSKYNRLHRANIIVFCDLIGDLNSDQPHPLWQEMSLRTPDTLRSAE